MVFVSAAVAAFAVGSAVAQVNSRPASVMTQGETGVNNSTAPTAIDGNRTIHYVTVGKGSNVFVPNSLNANVGDIVSFQFFPTNHSVIKAAYGYPCIPYDDIFPGEPIFYSGFQPVATVETNPPTWNLTINDTQPIFYYCGAPGSCTDFGMLGGINLNGTTSLEKQITLAKQSDYELEPGEPFPNEDVQASLSSAAQLTTATETVTFTPTSATAAATSSAAAIVHHSTLSGGAIAGIAIGGCAVALGAAALFFLLGRTRAYKKRIDQQQFEQNMAQQHGGPGFPHSSAAYYDQSRHTSQYTSGLPPYQYNGEAYGDALKSGTRVSHMTAAPSLASGPMSPPLPYSPPASTHRGFNYFDPNAPPQSYMPGELHGDVPPRTEMFAPHVDSSAVSSAEHDSRSET